MEWLNSFLTTLTSVQPEKVPLVVIIVVAVALAFSLLCMFIEQLKLSVNWKKQSVIISRLEERFDGSKATEAKRVIYRDTTSALGVSLLSHSINKNACRWRTEIKRRSGDGSSRSIFTEQQLIDIPLNTEFLSTCRGILTGVGIIGTFYGLMIGLNHFVARPSKLPAVWLRSCGMCCTLLGSFTAIAASIFVTWLEKLSIAKCYKYLEQFTAAVDQLFGNRCGEEYLAELGEIEQRKCHPRPNSLKTAR